MNFTYDSPEQEFRIVGFEVTPYSISNAWACEPGVDLTKIGPSILESDQAIHFSYNLTIEHTGDAWTNRLDHYFNYGSNRLFWEQLVASLTVLVFGTLLFGCVISCALSRDNDVLRYLRAKYRTSRFNTARSRFLRSGPNYAPVGQESRQNIQVDAPLKREVAWKKLSGDIFRKPSCPMLLSVLFGSGMQVLVLFVTLLIMTFCGTLSAFNM